MNEDTNSDLKKQPDFSFGKRLATARGALNLSREEVSKELRLSVEIITALEEEDYEQLLAPIFVNGYLRNYARLLKIPVEPLLAAYSQIQVDIPSLVSDAARKPKPAYSKLLVRTASLLIFLILIAGAVSWLQNQEFEFPQITSLLEQNTETVSAGPDEIVPVLPEPKEGDEPPVDVIAEAPVSSATEDAAEVAAEPVKLTEVEIEPPVAPVKNHVRVSVKEDSWVEVSDNDGKRLIYDLLRAGKDHTVTGSTPFKVFLGNAKGVRIKYNGEFVDVAKYTRGNLARFKLGAAGE